MSNQKPTTFPSLNKTLRQEFISGGIFGGRKSQQKNNQ
jgi:hypothetical protein